VDFCNDACMRLLMGLLECAVLQPAERGSSLPWAQLEMPAANRTAPTAMMSAHSPAFHVYLCRFIPFLTCPLFFLHDPHTQLI